MRINKTDITHSRNMLKAFGKGEWKLEGMEILAFSDMMRWFASFQKAMEVEISNEEALERFKAEEQERLNKAALNPKPVEDVVKPVDVPSPSAVAPKLRGTKQ